MTEPDELYTLRAQFWLGHYQLCIEEGRFLSRRPMSPGLKAERDEFICRAQIASGQSVDQIEAKTPALQALKLLGKQKMQTQPSETDGILENLSEIISSNPQVPSVQLAASQIYLARGMPTEALRCVHAGATMEHLAMCLQIYLKIDRIDLAESTLTTMKRSDEESVLTQLGGVLCQISSGTAGAKAALHALSMLSEQYGPSPSLVNTTAVAHMVAGDYATATTLLTEARADESSGSHDPDALLNLVACGCQTGSDIGPLLEEMRAKYPNHPMVQNLNRVEAALDREAVKYAVSS